MFRSTNICALRLSKERPLPEDCIDKLKKSAPLVTSVDSSALLHCMIIWELPKVQIAKFLLSRMDKKYTTPMRCIGDIIGQDAVPKEVLPQTSSLLPIVTSCISSFKENGVEILQEKTKLS